MELHFWVCLMQARSPQDHLDPSWKEVYLGDAFTFPPEMLVILQVVIRDLEIQELCRKYVLVSSHQPNKLMWLLREPAAGGRKAS